MKSYSETIVDETSFHYRQKSTLRFFVSLFYCNRNSIIDQRIAKLLKTLTPKHWNELTEAQRIYYTYEKAAIDRAIQRMLRLKN